MSFLYEEKTSKIMKWIGGFFAIIIIISMIILYSPGLIPNPNSGGNTPTQSTPVP